MSFENTGDVKLLTALAAYDFAEVALKGQVYARPSFRGESAVTRSVVSMTRAHAVCDQLPPRLECLPLAFHFYKLQAVLNNEPHLMQRQQFGNGITRNGEAGSWPN